MRQAGVKHMPPRGRAPVFLVSALAFAVAALLLALPAMAALPPGRALEQVSPVQKNGGNASGGSESVGRSGEGYSYTFASPGGNRVVYNSYGAFAGAPSGYINQYLAERTASGWVNKPLTPTQGVASFPSLVVGFNGFLCHSCSTVFGDIPWAAEPGDENEAEDLYTTNGDLTWQRQSIGSLPDTDGVASFGFASENGSTLAFNSFSRLTPAATETEPGAEIGYFRRNGVTVPVAEMPNGTLLNKEGSRIGPAGHAIGRNAIGPSGSPIFFQSPSGGVEQHVYARLANEELIQLDVPQCTGPCTGGFASYWVGASADGSIAYFVSDSQLVDAAKSENKNIYSYDLSTGRLKLIAGRAGAGFNQLFGFWIASHNGSKVYIVSKEALVSTPNAAGETPREGWENTYLVEYDALHPEGQITFIGHGAEELYPAEVAELSPDGRYALIESNGALSPEYSGGTKQVYLFDAKTKAIECLSCGGVSSPIENRFNNLAFGPTNSGAVLFPTAQTLVPQDDNGILDTYLHEGGIGGPNYLLSSGHGTTGSEPVGMSEDGQDAFFETFDRLLPSDVDGNADIYDARIGGGFLENPPRVECEGAGCSPAVTMSPAAGALGSAVVTGAGDPKPHKPAKHKKKSKHKKKAAKHKKKGGRPHKRANSKSGANHG